MASVARDRSELASGKDLAQNSLFSAMVTLGRQGHGKGWLLALAVYRGGGGCWPWAAKRDLGLKRVVVVVGILYRWWCAWLFTENRTKDRSLLQ